MAKRPTIGDNPLDSLIQPIAHNAHATSSTLEIEDEPKKKPQKQVKSQKQRITVQISEDVIERLKNAVYWTPGLTLAALAEEAFSKSVDALEEKNGSPFPKRKNELKTGRPLL